MATLGREAALSAQLVREGLRPTRWSNAPDVIYGEHEHPYGKVLVVASGSITFTVEGRGAIAIRVGDRLEIPPGTRHRALVGPEGVVCLEVQVPQL